MPWYSSEVGKITCPWVMAGTNAKVVLRSNFLQDNAYGKNFQYVEQMGMPATFGGCVAAENAAPSQFSAGRFPHAENAAPSQFSAGRFPILQPDPGILFSRPQALLCL
jgi:hypothetical protein